MLALSYNKNIYISSENDLFILCHACMNEKLFTGLLRVLDLTVWPHRKYSEHQKKVITSSEQRSLKSTPSKLIIFGYRQASTLLMKHIWKKQRFACVKKEKMQWNRRSFFKNHVYSEHSIAIHSISMAGYVTTVLAFVHAKLCVGGKQFLWFKKNDLSRFHIFSFLVEANLWCFFLMCLIRITS